MKPIEEIKSEIVSLLNEAAKQGVFIGKISAHYVVRIDSYGTLSRIEIEEERAG